MMIAVFGPTGGTGLRVIHHALAAGHGVTAFARSPQKVTPAHPQLKVVGGDVLDAEAVERAVAGHDAVISVLGTGKVPVTDTTQSQGIEHVIAAMKRQGVRRLLSVSAFGVADGLAQTGWLFGKVLLPLWIARSFGYADKARQEQAIKASGLEWTIVRPAHLVDGPGKGRWRVIGAKGNLYEAIPRDDVARFLIEELVARKFVEQTPSIAS